MLATKIDQSLPFVKQQAVTVLAADYKTTEEAVKAIDRDLTGFYQSKYPDVYASKQPQIKAAVARGPAHLPEQHLPGDESRLASASQQYRALLLVTDASAVTTDNHVSGGRQGAEARIATPVIPSNRKWKAASRLMGTAQGVAFQHPVDLGDMTAVNCADCHTGGVGP